MNSKFKLTLTLVAASFILMLPSCGEDEVELAAPTISNLEVGTGNSLMATIGSDLHLDAEIVAEGKIASIEIDMHNEDGTGDDIEVVFTNYNGKLNADFHEHIDIPSTTTEGDYHFHIKVTDEEGQSTEVDREVQVSAGTVSTAPEIEDLEVGENDNHTATVGGELHLDAHIHAPELIDNIVVELHPEGTTGDDIEATFTNYAGEEEADFHEHVEIPATAATGEYHMHLIVTDQAGQETEVDADVTIE